MVLILSWKTASKMIYDEGCYKSLADIKNFLEWKIIFTIFEEKIVHCTSELGKKKSVGIDEKWA